MKKIGLIVNPVAGIGGKVGLKGSDGEKILKRALELGAKKESGKKALVTLKMLKEVEDQMCLITCPGEMGEDICREAGLKPQVLRRCVTESTCPNDTIVAAKAFLQMDVDLILFAGGDGTARDIMDAVGVDVTVLGIPAGCKIHSAVYALNPKNAGRLMKDFILGKVKEVRTAEVMDIDEELFRQGMVRAKLYGYLLVPDDRNRVQNLKSGKGKSESAYAELAANYVADSMKPDILYIVGTGSTTALIMEKLGLSNTLLGVDLVYNRQVIAEDCTEAEILAAIAGYEQVEILVTIIGGQGYVFGRGNQQISAKVLSQVGKNHIQIVASKSKVMELWGQHLHADTGDEKVNEMLKGYYKVIVGYEDYMMLAMTDE